MFFNKLAVKLCLNDGYGSFWKNKNKISGYAILDKENTTSTFSKMVYTPFIKLFTNYHISISNN